MHAFVTLKLIEIDPNKIGIYLTETEFYALLIILVANLIYDYAKDNSEILFSTNEVRFQLGYIVILHNIIYVYIIRMFFIWVTYYYMHLLLRSPKFLSSVFVYSRLFSIGWYSRKEKSFFLIGGKF